MAKYAVTTFLIFMAMIGFAQFKITGKIIDQDNRPLEFVNLSLKEDTKIIQNTSSDSIGSFYFRNLKPNKYNLFCTYLTFAKKQISIDVIDDTTIILKLDVTNTLEEIIITGKKPLIERKIDKLVFNIENSITPVGGDALDALRVTPSVQVGNDQIGLVGKSSVSLMLNDKFVELSGTDLIGFLKTIKAQDLAKIEVISNPTAKYDAEGNSGIINLILKKNSNVENLSGTIYSSYEQRTYATISLGVGVNYKHKKLNVSTGLNAINGRSAPEENMTIYYPYQTVQQKSNRIDYRKNLSFRLTADYQLSKNLTIGTQYLGGYGLPDVDENILTQYINPENNNIDSLLLTNAYKTSKNEYHSFNFNFNAKIDSIGRKIYCDINYLTRIDNNERPFSSLTYDESGLSIPNSLLRNKNIGSQEISILTSKIDIEIPNKIVDLTFGAKASFIQNKSNNAFYNSLNNEYYYNVSQSDTFAYNENNQAIYFSLDKVLNKWELQIGLRDEMTQTKGYSLVYDQTNSNRYMKLFPTFFVNYKQNENSTFSLSYNKRISRPSYRWLNPFRWYLNPNNYSEGNPFLQPTYRNSIELSHLYKNTLNSTLYFYYQTDGYTQLAFVSDTSNLVVFKPINFFQVYTIGINEYWQLTVSKNLSTYFGLVVFYNITNSNNALTIPSRQSVSANIQNNSTYVLNKKKTLSIEMNVFYQLPQVVGILIQKGFGSLDLGIKYLLFDKALTVGFNASDIFKTSVGVLTNNINGINERFANYYDNRQFRLSLNYSFGNKKIIGKQIKQSNDEERGRTN